MHPRIVEVLDYLDARRIELERAVEAVPHELRERRPGPERWSVAEVLEHLSLVEGGIAQRLSAGIAAARTAGLGAEQSTAPVIPTVDLARVLDRSHRLTASEAQLPRDGLDAAAALAALTAQREALRAAALAADGLALEEVVVPSAVLGPLNAYQWVVFAGGHEARHAQQIREAGSILAG